MKGFVWFCMSAALASGMVAARSHAAIVNLSAAQDNTLYQNAGGNLSNGSGQGFFAGENGLGMMRRGLIAFDFASIPQNAVINSVTLTLHVSQANSISTSVTLHRVLQAWGEGASDAGASGGGGGGEGAGTAPEPGDATWLHTFYDSSFWSTPGGDFDPTISASQNVSGVGFYSWSAPGLVSDVQNWLINPGQNFGWMVRGSEDLSNTAKRFDSRENLTQNFRPVLTIDYTVIPAPAALPAMIMGAIGLRQRRRRAGC
jgi:hypothetical protein